MVFQKLVKPIGTKGNKFAQECENPLDLYVFSNKVGFCKVSTFNACREFQE
jgi:hypothetical protein